MRQDAAHPTRAVESGPLGALPSNSQSSTPRPPPPAIPDHELLHKIGGGSYGGVWLARNVIGTHHAVKIIYRSAFDHDRPFEREFEGIQKAMPVSRSLPGLVHILHVGRNEPAGYFYYVMELADDASAEFGVRSAESTLTRPSEIGSDPMGEESGEGSRSDDSTLSPSAYQPKTLQSELKQRGPLPVDQCVDLGLALTTALAHLHARGLVHRDLKPSNIIFVRGAPKLADIGLLASASEARSFVGTAGFIPPEGPGTPQADLYSLGKVLYEISTGKDRQDFPELPLELIQGRPPARESSRSRRDEAQTSKSEIRNPKPEVPVPLLELNGILVKACDSDFRKRYQTAQQMHDELELLQRGHSIKRRRAVERRVALGWRIGLAGAGVALFIALGSRLNHRNLTAPRAADASEMRGTTNRAAWNAHRLGEFHRQKRTESDAAKALAYFEEATKLDPGFALAHAQLGGAYEAAVTFGSITGQEAYPKAKAALAQALALAPNLPEATVFLAVLKTNDDFDWRAAEALYRSALARAPTDSYALHRLGVDVLASLGRHRESIAALQRSVELNPAAFLGQTGLGICHYFARDHGAALEAYRRAIELEPESIVPRLWRVRALLEAGLPEEAFRECERVLAERPRHLETKACLGVVHARTGRTDAAADLLRELEPRGEENNAPFHLAWLCAALGQLDRAMTWLERAYEQRSFRMMWLNVDPLLDSLHDQARFHALRKKVRLEN
ncbi:MAG: tetratricopeptide repeat protein [Verrucomicrobia bacterium]|nr:tetratricopeptide repeat protein [Verrucomicrobiota bacterium]